MFWASRHKCDNGTDIFYGSWSHGIQIPRPGSIPGVFQMMDGDFNHGKLSTLYVGFVLLDKQCVFEEVSITVTYIAKNNT